MLSKFSKWLICEDTVAEIDGVVVHLHPPDFIKALELSEKIAPYSEAAMAAGKDGIGVTKIVMDPALRPLLWEFVLLSMPEVAEANLDPDTLQPRVIMNLYKAAVENFARIYGVAT